MRIDLNWREIGLPKWPPAAILKKKSKKKSCVLIWNGRQMHSIVIFGHPKWPPAAILWKKIKVTYWSEMARNAFESDFRSSKMTAGSYFVKKNQKKLGIDLKWREMWSKVIFGHPKWALAVMLWQKNKSCVLIWIGEKSDFQNGRRQPYWKKNQKKKVAYWSEMARNAFKSDFRPSKMAAGTPFCEKKSKLRIDLTWREMHSKVIFGHPKWPPAAILWKKIKVAYWSEMARNAIKSDFSVIQNEPLAAILWKKKVAYWSEMARNAIESDFRSSKMAAGSHFVEKIKVVYWSEMARNAIVNDFRPSKIAAGSHFVIKIEYWSKMARNVIWLSKMAADSHLWIKIKVHPIVLKWREIGLPKWPLAAILKKKFKKKVAYWSEMARNAFKSDLRSSKMAAGSHFVKKKLGIDLKWWEMWSKVIFGHPKWPPAAIWKKKKKLRIDLKWREMRSKVIFRSSKMATGSHFVQKKLRIDLNWWEMRSKVIFGHPKWPPAAILWKKSKKSKVVYWSEMARNAYWSEMGGNAIESYFRSCKLAAGSHFVNKIKNWVLIWNGEKCDLVIQNGRRQPFCEKKIKVTYWSEMARNAIRKVIFRSSKMAAGSHFVKQNQSCILIWNGEKCDQKWFFGHPKWPLAAILWKKSKLCIDLKWREMRSKIIFGHPK